MAHLKWNLRVVQADRRISNKRLAELTQLHYTTISKLRKAMPPRLEAKTLEKLCWALDCTPGDLIKIAAHKA